MTSLTVTRVQQAPAPLSFDERLALAALAVDARINSTPLDLADVIRIPVTEPEPAAAATTPLAACLRRAHARIMRDGWTTGRRRDETGATCLYGAIRAEADTPAQAHAASSLLLDSIRRTQPDAQSVPAWNDAQTDPGTVLRMLDQAARDAERTASDT